MHSLQQIIRNNAKVAKLFEVVKTVPTPKEETKYPINKKK